MVRIIIGVAIGTLVGALVGYLGKHTGGSCSITCNPVGGILVGALLGGLIASSISFSSTAGPVSDKVIEVSSAEQFERILAENKVVLADFYADWCGPCRALKPTVHAVADEYSGRIAVVAINVDNNSELASKHGISSIPDVRLFSSGRQADQFIGVQPKSAYAEAVERALGNQVGGNKGEI